MPVTQRGWSLNSYALSKVWSKTKCVDLRACDITNITKTYKSWLYQDMFAKPEEMILHRPQHYGGLGLHSLKYKAIAGFITTFLQTAVNPSFCQNLLHSLLFRKYVLNEDESAAPDPPPPYFTPDLFSIIRKVKDESPLNIVTMTEKDWSRLLTEDCLTMTTNPETEQRHFTPCKAELASPSTDWSLSWAACRQPGVSPELASFLWRMMLNLLPTQAKLHRMGTIKSPICRMQGCPESGTLVHELLHCSKNDGVGYKLLSCLQHYIPGLQAEAALRLEHGDIEVELSLPLTLVTAIILSTIWKEREVGTPIRSYKVRAEMEQYITLLRTSRINKAIATLKDMLHLMF